MRRLFLLILMLLIPLVHVYADPIDFNMDGCIDYNFQIGSQLGWTLPAVGSGTPTVRGTWAGDKFSHTSFGAGSNWSRAVYIRLQFDDTLITSVTMNYVATVGGSNGGSFFPNRRIRLLNNNSQVGFSGQDTLVGGGVSWTYDGYSVVADQIDVDISAGYASSSGALTGSADILMVTVCGGDEEGILRPLESQHEDPSWGLFDWTDDGGFLQGGSEYTVSAMSTAPGAPVHAVIGGTVTNVERLTINKCLDRMGVNLGILDTVIDGINLDTIACTVFIPASITGLSGPSLYFLRGEFLNSGNLAGDYAVTNMYLVEVLGSDGHTYEYFVKDATVEEGQEIAEGCILGVTSQLTDSVSMIPPLHWIVDLFTSNNVSQGFAAVTRLESGDPAELLPDLTIYPGPNSKCNQDPEFADCLGDSKLENSSDWTSVGTVTWLEPGVQLGPQGGISSIYNLDADREPQMRVSARAATGSPSLFLRLGDTTDTLAVTSNQFEEYEIAAAEHQPNNGLFYDIVLRNSASSGIIEIEWVCISFTLDEEGNPEDGEGEPDPPPFPEHCESNPEPEGSDVGDWTRWHWNNLDGFFRCDLMVFLNMQYRTLTEFFDTITWTIRWFMAVFVQGVDWLGEQFLPWLGGYLGNASGSAGLTFTSNLPIIPSAIMSVLSGEEVIYEVQACNWNDLTCHLTGTFNGLADAVTDWLNEAAENLTNLFNAAAASIDYHFSNLWNTLYSIWEWFVGLFNDLIDLIMSIWDWFVGIFNDLLGIIEFAFSTIWNILYSIWDWFEGVLGSIINLIGNILSSLTGTVIGFLEGVFNAAINLAKALISMFIWVIIQIVEMILFIRDLISGIINAWNTSAPASIPGITVCDPNSSEPSQVICWLYWVAEHTIFSGNIGALILPLLVATGVIISAIRFVRDIRKTFLDVTQRIAG